MIEATGRLAGAGATAVSLRQRSGEPEAGGATFGEQLQEALTQVNKLQLEAEQASRELVSGDLESLHRLMIKTEEAGLALQLTVQVVNKAIQAYQEMTRLQI